MATITIAATKTKKHQHRQNDYIYENDDGFNDSDDRNDSRDDEGARQ